MPDREKIIRQWEGIIDQIKQGNMRRPIATTLVYDTFALLIEQEPVKPKPDFPDSRCPECGEIFVGELMYYLGHPIEEYYRHCPGCGRRIKWDA